MPGTWEVDGVQHGKDIILEDKAGKQFSESLAHEIVHVMGPGDLKKGKKLLMYQYTTIRGRKLPKRHANTINP